MSSPGGLDWGMRRIGLGDDIRMLQGGRPSVHRHEGQSLWSERPVAEPVLSEAVGWDLGFGQRIVGPVGLLVAEALVAEGDAVDDVDKLGDEIRLDGTRPTREMSLPFPWEAAGDGLEPHLALVGQAEEGL